MGQQLPPQETPVPGAGVFASAPAYPRLIAHRGGGSSAPENTLAAIRAGHRAGFAGVEFDAMLSAEGTPFLIHDETLERTSNGCGAVAASSDALLAGLDAGGWHSPAFRGEPLPTLAAALSLCRSLGLWVNLEIKPSRGREAETGAAVAEVAAQAVAAGLPASSLVLSSFAEAALEAARQAAPGLARALLVAAVPADWEGRLARLGAVALHCAASGLYEDAVRHLVAGLVARGGALACYTVNDAARISALLQWGVAGVFTDRLDLAGLA